MKFAIGLLQFAVALVIAAPAHAAIQVREVDFATLQSSCESNLGRYITKLSDAHDAIAEEVSSMTKTEYEDAFDAQDPKIMLAIATWPSVTKSKDEFWKANLTCATFHREARNALMSGRKSMQEKKEAVKAFADCVETKITRGADIAPLSGLLRCYEGHAGSVQQPANH